MTTPHLGMNLIDTSYDSEDGLAGWAPSGSCTLVNADGKYTQVGNMFAGLRRECTSHARGQVDSNGNFKFRGFHGTYQVLLTTAAGEVKKRTFDVNKGDAPLVLDMDF